MQVRIDRYADGSSSDTNAEQRDIAHALSSTLLDLVSRLQHPSILGSNVIPWGCPVPSFGDLSTATIATVGLNPSNREFVDGFGTELEGTQRRLHTLRSLGLERWADVDERHLNEIMNSCRWYFARNPYLGWFGDLDDILVEAAASYHDLPATACHLDLIPYATTCKWTELTVKQRGTLLDHVGDTLGELLRKSSIRLLVLNGMTVVRNLEKLAAVEFEQQEMKEWTLPRKAGDGVLGLAYRGTIDQIAGVRLTHPVRVLGYNHNIQSSFGVTTKVKVAIKRWIGREAKGVLGAGSGQGTCSKARCNASLFPCE